MLCTTDSSVECGLLHDCRRQELSYECKATLFDQEVRMAENIDFQFPMKKACRQDIQACSIRLSSKKLWADNMHVQATLLLEMPVSLAAQEAREHGRP